MDATGGTVKMISPISPAKSEDRGDKEPLDFHDRNIQSAMKVCGVTMDDLMPKAMMESPQVLGTDQHLIQQWYEKREQRRQRLLSEVEKLAGGFQDAPGGEIVAFPAKERMSQACKDMFEKGKQKLQQQRKMARDNVQRVITEKYQFEQAKQAQSNKLEEQNKKMKEKKAEDQAELQAKIEKRDAKKEKINQRLSEARKLANSKAKEFYSRIESPAPMTPRNTPRNAPRNPYVHPDDEEEGNEQLQRKWKLERMQRQKRIDAHEVCVEREKIVHERQEQNQQERVQNSRNFRLKAEKRMEDKESGALKEEEKLAKTYYKLAERLTKAGERVNERQDQYVEKLQTEKAKWGSKRENNLQAQKEIRREDLQRFRKKAWEDVENAQHNKLRVQAEQRQAREGRQNIIGYFVDEQKKMIQRKDDYKFEQAMQRCRISNERTDTLLEQKELLHKQRMADTQDSLIDKSTLQNTIDGVKSANTEKVNAVLKSLGLPLMPVVDEKKEGENTENQLAR